MPTSVSQVPNSSEKMPASAPAFSHSHCLRPERKSFSKTGAFTLTELLAVIAIIGVLAAIIIPTVGKIRESARATQCASNLRQVFNLYMVDVQEHRGRLPVYKEKVVDPVTGATTTATHIWIQGIATKYYGAEAKGIGQALGCPVQIDVKGQPLLDNSVKNKRAPCTYSLNNRDLVTDLAANAEIAKTLASVTFPARTALAGDGNDTDHALDYYNGVIGVGRPPETPHNGKANIVFLDGHVTVMSDQTLLNVTSTPKAGTAQAMFWFGE